MSAHPIVSPLLKLSGSCSFAGLLVCFSDGQSVCQAAYPSVSPSFRLFAHLLSMSVCLLVCYDHVFEVAGSV